MPALPSSPEVTLHAPSPCVVCHSWGWQALCGDCVARFAAPQPRCARCGLRLGLAAPACGACLREPPAFEHTVCVADYGFPWNLLVAELKFRDRPELAGSLAPLLADAVQAAGRPLPDLVLPVPLSAQRLAERGYNQAWELARRIARTLGLPAHANWLQHPIDTPHQVASRRDERLRNLRSAFMLDPRRRADICGRRVALVDDVMTTGATVQQAAAVLLRAGAAAVDVWVLARTPEH